MIFRLCHALNARFSKRVYVLMYASLTVSPEGPFLCFPIMISATPGSLQALLGVNFITINESDYVRILLYGSAFTKIAQKGPLVSALLDFPVQLSDGDHRDIQLFRQPFERTGYL